MLAAKVAFPEQQIILTTILSAAQSRVPQRCNSYAAISLRRSASNVMPSSCDTIHSWLLAAHRLKSPRGNFRVLFHCLLKCGVRSCPDCAIRALGEPLLFKIENPMGPLRAPKRTEEKARPLERREEAPVSGAGGVEQKQIRS